MTTPSPVPAPVVHAPGLSTSQRQLLELLKRAGPATAPALAAGIRLNVETVRHHLRALDGRGYVMRLGTRPTRPGRPEVQYGLTPAAEQLFPRREGQLLQALAQHLAATGNERLLEEFFEGWIESRRAAAHARLEGLEGTARLQEVALILSDLGFMATSGTAEDPRLHLCHCPLRELVEVSTVPCRAELGFIRELLGAQLTRLAYIPAGDASCSYRARSA